MDKRLTITLTIIVLMLIASSIMVSVNQPKERGVIIRTYQSNDAMLQALRSGDVDVAYLQNAAPSVLADLRNDPSLNVVPIPSFGFTYIGMNMRNPPLDNESFRKAMLYGFNRQNVLKTILAGYGEVLAPGLFSSAYDGLGWRNSSVNAYPYNPQRAEGLLDSLGYTGSPGELRVDPSTGQSMRTMFIFSRLSDSSSVAVGDQFARDMRAIGLPVISFPVSDVDFNLQTKMTYYFDMYVQTVSTSPAPTWLGTLFASSNDISPAPLSTNLVGYHNGAFDASLEQLLTANNSATARTAAYRCQEQLDLDVPVIPVFSKDMMLVTRPGFKIVPATGSVEETLAQSLVLANAGTTTIAEPSGLTSLNPSLVIDSADLLTLHLITQQLFETGANGTLLPGIASDWHLTNNSTSLSIVLRQGTAFGDGAPITAHDLAGTIEWLKNNAGPSSPFYSIINQTASVVEVDSRTVTVTLKQPNSLVDEQFANLFVLPANLLPATNTPLDLLKSGGLLSSGPFTLERFVQGNEVDLTYNALLPDGTWTTISSANLYGVASQDVSGTPIGGSRIRILFEPLTYQGQQIENATVITQIINPNGAMKTIIQNSYLGFGIYQTTLDLNNHSISTGTHTVQLETYTELPSGTYIEFDQKTLTVNPPLLIWQISVYLLTITLIAFAALAPPSILKERRRVQTSRARSGKAVRYCRKCGARVGPRNKFCLKCGAKIRRRTS
ncbi:MAG TPA: ABC transporter substrate-binding protein [Terriglobales bacterium]|nr:ABC transporter substrate-binding protein [Terriglobales bacterium]